ncbi:hypothetical protein [Archangium lansingense]|uniref:hypothetical protein n=1 Tax=Archangium lansingense TaxID=2995310 RepID=UPI00280B8A5F|nr:hypothetical protein [Archangium lansinium]
METTSCSPHHAGVVSDDGAVVWHLVGVCGARVRVRAGLDVLFLRKDPPVDADFLQATQLVELCNGREPVLLNNPTGIRDANEKLFGLRFPELMPETLIARDLTALAQFIARNLSHLPWLWLPFQPELG